MTGAENGRFNEVLPHIQSLDLRYGEGFSSIVKLVDNKKVSDALKTDTTRILSIGSSDKKDEFVEFSFKYSGSVDKQNLNKTETSKMFVPLTFTSK